MRLLFLILLLAAPPAMADSIARQGDDWVRLSPRMCADRSIRAVILQKGGDPEEFRAAYVHVDGKDYAACWQPVGAGAGLIYADGVVGIIPLTDLKLIPEL